PMILCIFRLLNSAPYLASIGTSITTADLLEWKVPCNIPVNCRESIRGIKYLPIPGRHLGHKGKYGIAKYANPWHCTNVFQIKETIPLRVIRCASYDGRHKIRY